MTAALLLSVAVGGTSAPAMAAGGAIRWATTTGDAVDSSPSGERGTIDVGSDDAKVHALDARTGTRDHKDHKPRRG